MHICQDGPSNIFQYIGTESNPVQISVKKSADMEHVTTEYDFSLSTKFACV